jgi:DNA modification methylase
MTLYCKTPVYELHRGDNRLVLPTLAENSVDGIVVDAPYELNFMAKGWDRTGIAYDVGMWREAMRVVKPGGWLVSFGGQRTYHRMVCAVEDGGFQIRDQIIWLFGQGFPKSVDVGKALAAGEHDEAEQFEGNGTALKPAHEPIVLARKPLDGGIIDNVLRHGTGTLNLDACRVAGDMDGVWGSSNETVNADRKFNASPDRDEYRSAPHDAGRWPANVITDGSAPVVDLFPQVKIAGELKSAARYFYCAKANKKDRDEGLSSLPVHAAADCVDRKAGSAGMNSPRAGAGRTAGTRNHHPTVKPVDLMRYLCRLIIPPGGVVLDHMMGSGSTGKAAMLEGFRFVGIELDKDRDIMEIARLRIMYARAKAKLEADGNSNR